MLTNAIRNKLWGIAATYSPERDWAHGRSHIERVLRNAIEIGRHEGADLEVVEIAAMFHDLFARKETHSSVEGFRHEVQGAMEARRILGKLGFESRLIEAVSHCIEAHRKRTGREPRTIEAKCLFDADKLDAIGAIGIVRSAFVSFDQEFYRDEKDLEAYKRKNIRPDGTIIDPSRHSSNLEYELSLKEIPQRIYTETGKRLAKERAAFMDEFYNRLEQEMKATL